MSAVISGELRREKILATLSAAEAPLSGSALGRACEVSRQVVVQDIALLARRDGPSNPPTGAMSLSVRPRAPRGSSSATTRWSRLPRSLIPLLTWVDTFETSW